MATPVNLVHKDDQTPVILLGNVPESIPLEKVRTLLENGHLEIQVVDELPPPD